MTFGYETTGDLDEQHYYAGLDADMEMAEYARQGREEEAARKRGECPHSHGYTGGPGMDFYPGQKDLLPGQFRCTDVCQSVIADPFEEIR